MFTGIVAAIGKIAGVSPFNAGQADSGVRLEIHVEDFLRPTTKLGDSIAIQGACMTVVQLGPDRFSVDVSRESLDCTAGLDAVGEVNLEHALRMGDSLDGHLVSGHVDGLGEVSRFEPAGESWELRIKVPASLARYLAYKGSVTVNGVSLTVNRVDDSVDGCEISINLIPHTVKMTTLKDLRSGCRVNLEVDTIARYCERMLNYRNIA
ncbi:riboflavin synthase [Candidimonas sp. SYP-B2681]|uniref:riboflavin synthase n=1 Tax=Candidimonas sp. SYP-B2681 TaxID=2497686 RepID=UPI000F86B445|nr:riboflavin synthase [Candidimonas sp. SYP-B2681]RTZ39947.1 riboflavin synthase [Candidimonas sp. SYP-B2681]